MISALDFFVNFPAGENDFSHWIQTVKNAQNPKGYSYFRHITGIFIPIQKKWPAGCGRLASSGLLTVPEAFRYTEYKNSAGTPACDVGGTNRWAEIMQKN